MKIVTILVNLIPGVIYFLAVGEGTPWSRWWPFVLLWMLPVVLVLPLGLGFISPEWSALTRLFALLVMMMAGVFLVTLLIPLVTEFESGLQHFVAGIDRQVREVGMVRVVVGFAARQVFFFGLGLVFGSPVWVPLWLINFFLFRMLK